MIQLASLRRNTALAWFDCYYQKQILDLLTQQRTEADLQIAAADVAYRTGKGTQADVFLARSAASQLDDRIRDARTRLATAGIALARWIGDSASRPLATPPVLSQTRLDMSDLKTLSHLLIQDPEIVLMNAKETLAQAEADVAKKNKHADWSVSLSYSQRGPAYSNMVSVGISIPLQWDQKNRQDRELSAKLAKVEQIQDEREEIRRERTTEIQQGLMNWRNHLERLSHYDATLLPLAVDRKQAILAAYKGSKAPLSSVLEARRMELDTRFERLRIEMETASLWVWLEYLLPEPLMTKGSAVQKVTTTNISGE
jgi:outer membrane protein TolC